MARGVLLGLVHVAWLLGATTPAVAVQSGAGNLSAGNATLPPALVRELSENSTATATLTSSTRTTTTTTLTSTTSNTATTSTTTTRTVTSTTSSTTTTISTTTTTSSTTTTTTSVTTTTATTTTVTVTVLAQGLTYCPSAGYYLQQPSSSIARCSASTSRRPSQLAVVRTSTTTTTTSRAVTVTGSKAFSVSLISLCCRSKEKSTTRPPFTSMNYLYQWPTTTSHRSTTSPQTVQTTSTVTSTRTISTTSTSTITVMPAVVEVNDTTNTTTTATSTVTLTSTTSTTSMTSTTTTSRTTVPGAPTTTFTTTSTSTTSATTTSVTTTSATTTTVTLTTATSTVSTTTSTTVTSTTTTSSSTTSSTTLTHTSTTTTTTTTSPRLYDCRPRCSRLPVIGCDSALPSGGQCMASKIDTHCVSSEPLTFRCPIWNVDPLRGPDVIGEFRLRCQVCGLAPWRLIDVDPRFGYLQLDLQFGPNAYDGQVLEDGISGYAVFMTDQGGLRFSSDPVATVTRKQGSHHQSDYCCKDTLYTARVATQFPENVTRVMFEVVPITRAGPLPSGRLTAPVDDRGLLMAAAHAAPRAGSRALAALLALAAAVAARAGDPG